MGFLSSRVVALVVVTMVVLFMEVVQGEQDRDNKNNVFSLEERNLLAMGNIWGALEKLADYQAKCDKKGPNTELSQLVSVVNSTQQQSVALQKAISTNFESLTSTTKELVTGFSTGRLNTKPECPSPFQPMYTQCILVKSDKKSWVDAKDDCVSNYGAELAEVKDLTVFTSYLVEKHLEADALLWVGGSDAHAENDWTWPSGAKVNPFYWGKNQPDNWHEEHCMNIDKDQFHLNDLDCGNQLGYICEKVFKSSIVDETNQKLLSVVSAMENTGQTVNTFALAAKQLATGNENMQKLLIKQFSTNDPEIECSSPYELVNSQCILMVPDKKNWDDALQSCANRDEGQLAQVNDLAVFTKYLKDKFPDAESRLWVGGSDRHAENDWRWPSGVKVNPYYWGEGQPDNWNEEHCMNIDNNQFHLNDLKCSEQLGFICEKVSKTSVADETNKKLLSIISAVEETQNTVKIFAEAAKESAAGNARAATTMENLQQFLVNHLTKNDQQTGGSSDSSITPNPIHISANPDIIGLADIINKTHNLVQQQIMTIQSDTSAKFELLLNAINSTQNSVELFAKSTADAITKLQQTVVQNIPGSDQETVLSPSSTINGPTVPCGPPYVAIGTDCLRLSTDKLDWTAAREACKLEEADLAMPDDLDRLKTYIVENDLRADYWVGGSDRLTEGEWTWLDGRPVDSEGWMPGQPDNLHSDLDCLDFRSEYSPPLNNYRCQNPQKYICEKTNVKLPDIELPITTSIPDGSCSSPWNLIGNECFRVYSIDGEQKSWNKAQETCKAQGGDLAEPDNELALRIYLLNNHLTNDYWVGGSYSEDESEWRWVSGRTAHPAPIPIPHGFLPPDINMNLHCLDFRTQRSPSVYPYRCSESQRFICEKMYEGTALPIPTLPTVNNDTCGSPYFLVGGECFRISNDEEAWESAMLNCQSEGGSLATPSNLDLLRRHLVSTGDVNDYWLGGHDKDGTWKWITGDLVEDEWQQGQPSGSAGEDCLDFRVGQSPSLNDYMCSMPQKYLCERSYTGTAPPEVPTTTAEPGSCSPPWVNIGSECFRVHSDEGPWQLARDNCQGEGGDLAQPNDVNALRAYLEENSMTKDYWIGGRDEGNSTWKWLSGRAIIDLWVPGEPAGHGDTCLDFRASRNPSLNDYSCGSSQPYICEKGEESVTNPTTTLSPGTIACGGGSYFELNGQCFAPYHTEKDWDSARVACQQEGGDLAEPADLNDFRTALHNRGFTRDSWVGGSDKTKEGEWKWLSGTEITNGWIQGEPASTGGDQDDCLDFRISRSPSLNDYTCHKSQPYICQRAINSSWAIVTTANPVDNSNCPTGYLTVGAECFRFYENQLTWDAARQTCKSMGGDLAQPKNFDTLRTYVDSNSVARDYWIGGHDDGSGWKWLSGEEIAEDKWIPGKPDKRGMENCLDFRSDRNPSLNDYKCHAEQRFICQTPCPASYFQVGSQCFSVKSEKKNWSDARTICRGGGGDLAAPLDLRELKTALAGKTNATSLWLGGSDSVTPGTWKWVSGTPITNSWIPGHPKSTNSCLTVPMSDPVVVSDTNCTETLSFVCEVNSNAPNANSENDKVCSSPYYLVEGQCYRIMAEKQNWAVARLKCKEDHGDLATPQNVEALRVHVVASNHDSDFWIGGSDTAVEGEWRWVSNQGVGELIPMGVDGGWDDSEPSGAKNENCLDFRAGRAPLEGAGPSRCLNDFRCTVAQPYICERKVTETGEYVTEITPVKVDNGCPSDYFAVGQECFRPEPEAKSWDSARTLCQDEEGDLAQPSDLDRLRLWLMENNLVNDYWLGGSDTREEGRWEWINGSNIVHGWMPGKPDSGTRENCLDFRVDTRPSLNDFICASPQSFICQKPRKNGATDAITGVSIAPTTAAQSSGDEPEITIEDTVTKIPLDEPCPDDFFSLSSECFSVTTDKTSWKEARTKCQEKGGDLAQPSNLAALRTYLEDRSIADDYWIGGSDIETEGTWKWINGTEITDGWGPDQPGGAIDQNCLDFRATKVPNSLNDYKCENAQKYICER